MIEGRPNEQVGHFHPAGSSSDILRRGLEMGIRYGIGTRLGSGFAICLLFTLIVGVAALHGDRTLSTFTEDLLAHPFAVTNAVRAANGDIIEIRGAMKDMALLVDPRQTLPLTAFVRERERDLDAQLAVVKERYLGPPADIDRVLRDYEALREVREKIIASAQDGDFATARALSGDQAALRYAVLRADMGSVLAFAQRRAADFGDQATALRDWVQTLTWLVLAGAVVSALAIAWLATRSITAPLAALQRSMRELSGGDLGIAVPGTERKDEIGEMSKVVEVFKDGLIQAEKLEQTLRQSQKMEAIGQLTGGIAHDFNNLLQVILTDLDLSLLRLEGQSVIAGYLRDAISEVERGAKLTSQLLAFARRQPLSPKPLRVDRLLTDMVVMLRRTIGEEVEIETVNGGGLWNALVDANQLQNAILNLAVNARDAMPDGGKLTFELSNSHLDAAYAADHIEVTPGQYVLLAVTDTGIGMPEEVVSKAFEPFFTTKPEGAGTGLGLSMVFGFVKQSGGHIKIYSEPGLGTTVKLYLPRARSAEMAREVVETQAVRGSGQTILVAEDDAGVRSSVVAQLAELGYRVLAAADGEEALAILSRGETIDLLFTDVVMPGALNGRALALKAREILPGLEVVFTSGYTENAIIHNGRLDEGVTLLSKPYRLPQLAEAVHKALATAVSSP